MPHTQNCGQALGGSISVSYGKMGGSLNVGKSNINSDFASVTEQSGLRAGDDGFQISVTNNTDLKGAVITSTDRAAQDGKNSLTTGSLTTSDIQNKAEYKGQRFNIGAGYSTGTNAASAAVDNNWLATQQIVQMKKEIKAAKSTLEELKVAGKWAYISTKQDVLTTAGVGKGLVQAGISDIKGLAEFLSDPIAGLNGLKQIITSLEAQQQLGDSIFKELDNRIDRMKTALQVGGDQNAVQLGQDLGALIWQVGSVATGVGGAAKGHTLIHKSDFQQPPDDQHLLSA